VSLRDELVNAPEQVDLLAPFPHIDASWCHELCIVANHNSYHAGQLLQLRRMLQQPRRRARRASIPQMHAVLKRGTCQVNTGWSGTQLQQPTCNIHTGRRAAARLHRCRAVLPCPLGFVVPDLTRGALARTGATRGG